MASSTSFSYHKTRALVLQVRAPVLEGLGRFLLRTALMTATIIHSPYINSWRLCFELLWLYQQLDEASIFLLDFTLSLNHISAAVNYQIYNTSAIRPTDLSFTQEVINIILVSATAVTFPTERSNEYLVVQASIKFKLHNIQT